jgi:hypothetical protein
MYSEYLTKGPVKGRAEEGLLPDVDKKHVVDQMRKRMWNVQWIPDRRTGHRKCRGRAAPWCGQCACGTWDGLEDLKCMVYTWQKDQSQEGQGKGRSSMWIEHMWQTKWLEDGVYLTKGPVTGRAGEGPLSCVDRAHVVDQMAGGLKLSATNRAQKTFLLLAALLVVPQQRVGKEHS